VWSFHSHLPINRNVLAERVANEGRDYQPAGQHRKGRSYIRQKHETWRRQPPTIRDNRLDGSKDECRSAAQ